MKNLLYKEFALTIHPLYFLVPLFGALLLIPQWPYFIALMYFFFISIPNIFAAAKAQNDTGFSAMLPIRRSDIVKARVLSIVVLELAQILVAALFVFINMKYFQSSNFLLDANIAFIGFVFIIYGVYNVVFFPMFYKTAYKIGPPVIVGLTAALLCATAIECLVLAVPFARVLDGKQNLLAQLPVLGLGIILFILLSIAAYKSSVKQFEKVDI